VVGELNREQREIVQLMKIGTLQLNGLVDNLLEYQRLANRQQSEEVEAVELSGLLHRLLEDYRLLIRSKQLVIREVMTPAILRGDRETIRMMLGNLLSNAIKFSPEAGEIALSLSADGGMLRFLIEDQGEGIPEQEQGLVFQEFYQGRHSGMSGVKGSGLGLALVRDAVQRYQGDVALLPPTRDYPGARIQLRFPRVTEEG